MNKNIALLLVLLLLGVGVFFVKNKNQTEGSIDASDRHFAVKDVLNIGKIFIADRTGNTTTLDRAKNNTWTLNGVEPARQEAVNTLLQTIRDLEMQYIPPNAAVNTIIENIAAEGVKVEIYDTNAKILKTFYVGGMTPDELGTYMIMEDSKQPFVMHVPHFEGGLLYRFWMKPEQWRDKAVYRENPDNIKKVSVEYPFQTKSSFILERKGNDFEVKHLNPLKQTTTKKVKKGLAEAYLYGFEEKISEDFETKHPKKDSIINSIPFCIINLERLDNSQKQVELFVTKMTKKATKDVQMVDDLILRYFAFVDDKDFFLTQDRVFKDILRSYDYFYD
jgi:hypothetical protein